MEQYGGSIEKVSVTVNSSGTTTLINTSSQIQVFKGTAGQTVILPDSTTYTKAGTKFEIYNTSTVPVVLQYHSTAALQTIPANAVLIVKCVDNTTSNGTWVTLSNSASPTVLPPTFQIFNSGSGTYTTPTSPVPLYLKVRMAGGGGGGAGGFNGGAAASNGTSSTFGTSLLIANGGLAGQNGSASGVPPSGGTVTVNSPAVAIVANTGGSGAGGLQAASSAGAGGFGGSNALGGAGGAGGSQTNASAAAGIANTGAGGGGGGSGGSGIGGGGGSAGGYIEAFIPTPSLSYTYAVGSGGAGGLATNNVGGNGGSGVIIVEEHYQ